MMWDIYLVIAAAFGVSTAMEVTGVAKILIDIGEALCCCLWLVRFGAHVRAGM